MKATFRNIILQIGLLNLDTAVSTGAKKAREVVFAVLRDACINEDLSVAESIQAVKDIFSENAIKLYKIKAASESIESNDRSSPSVKLDVRSSAQGVAFVRIIWIDASGQHRCRVSLFLSSLLVQSCYET